MVGEEGCGELLCLGGVVRDWKVKRLSGGAVRVGGLMFGWAASVLVVIGCAIIICADC